MSRKPTVVSLFSGVGGLDLGFEQAGYELIWANENDLDAAKSHELNFGLPVDTRDIREITDAEFPVSDVLIGGFPCQGFSVANMNRSATDGRNKLYLEFVRAINAAQPSLFVAENVKGILTLAKGQLFKKIKEDFAAAGYQVIHHLFNAADYGVPQRRERVFLLGIKSGLDSSRINFPPEPTHEDKRRPTLLDLRPWISVAEALDEIPEPGVYDDFTYHQPSEYKLVFSKYLGHRPVDGELPSPTVTGRGDSKGGVVVLPHHSGIRRMTPRELAIIQGFPTDFKFHGTKSTVYRLIANAVPPPLAKAVAKSVFPVFENSLSSPLNDQVYATR